MWCDRARRSLSLNSIKTVRAGLTATVGEAEYNGGLLLSHCWCVYHRMTNALLIPEEGAPIPIGSGRFFIGRAFQKNLSHPCFSRQHLELRRAGPVIELLVKGLNPVTIHTAEGRTVLRHGQRGAVAAGDRIEIVEGVPQLRFRVALGAQIPRTVTEVQFWLYDKLPQEAWEVAALACHQERIDGKVLQTLSEVDMGQILGVRRFGDRRRLTLATRQLARSMDSLSPCLFGTKLCAVTPRQSPDRFRMAGAVPLSSICQNSGVLMGNEQHMASLYRGHVTGSGQSKGCLNQCQSSCQSVMDPGGLKRSSNIAMASPCDKMPTCCTQVGSGQIPLAVTLGQDQAAPELVDEAAAGTAEDATERVAEDAAEGSSAAARAEEKSAVIAEEAAAVASCGKRRWVTFAAGTQLEDGDSAARLHKRARQLSMEQLARADGAPMQPKDELTTARARRRQKRQQMNEEEKAG